MIDFDKNYMRREPALLAVILSRAVHGELDRPGLCMLNGQSLLAWSLESAMNASSVREVTVVTQDAESTLAAARLCRGAKPVRILQVEPGLNECQCLSRAALGRDLGGLSVASLGVSAPLREASDIDAAAEMFEQARDRQMQPSPLRLVSVSHLLRAQGEASLRWVLRDVSANCRLDGLRAGLSSQVYAFGTEPVNVPGIELVSLNSALTIFTSDAINPDCDTQVEQLAYILPEERAIEIECVRDVRQAQAVLGLRNRTTVFAPSLIGVL